VEIGCGVAHVAEHHGLYVHRRTQVIGDLVHLPVVRRPRIPPGLEDRVAGHFKLPEWILREFLAGFFLVDLLVILDDHLQVLGGEVGIILSLHLLLPGIENPLEFLLLDVHDHVAEHLDEAAIAVIGEPGVLALGDQALDAFVVEAEVQDGVHHSRHGELGPGAHAHQQGILRIAQLLVHLLFKLLQRRGHFFVHFLGHLALVLEIDVADLGGNRESRGNRHARTAHLGQTGAFAAEDIFHGSIAVGGTAAE